MLKGALKNSLVEACHQLYSQQQHDFQEQLIIRYVILVLFSRSSWNPVSLVPQPLLFLVSACPHDFVGISSVPLSDMAVLISVHG